MVTNAGQGLRANGFLDRLAGAFGAADWRVRHFACDSDRFPRHRRRGGCTTVERVVSVTTRLAASVLLPLEALADGWFLRLPARCIEEFECGLESPRAEQANPRVLSDVVLAHLPDLAECLFLEFGSSSPADRPEWNELTHTTDLCLGLRLGADGVWCDVWMDSTAD